MTINNLLKYALMLAVGLGCGCGKSSPDPSGRAAEPRTLSVDTLIVGSTPQLPAQLTGLKFGDAQQTVEGITRGGVLKVPEYVGPFQLHFDAGGRLINVEFATSPSAVLTTIEAAWGPGIASGDITDEYRVWVDEAKKFRVVVHERGVVWGSYTPFATFLGEGAGVAALNATGGTLLKLTRDDIERNYGPLSQPAQADLAAMAAANERKVHESMLGILQERLMPWVNLPATEYSDVSTRCFINFDASGKVDHFWFEIPYAEHPRAKEQIADVAHKKWDPELAPGGSSTTILSTDPRIRMELKMEPVWQFHVQNAAIAAKAPVVRTR